MAAARQPNYRRSGGFDKAAFQAEFTRHFSRNPRYCAAAMPDMLVQLGLIERDTEITDIRWAAYLLATVMWGTTSPTTVSHVAVSKKGKPLLDKKGRPVVVQQRKWLMTMAPVAEVGQGKVRRYHARPIRATRMA